MSFRTDIMDYLEFNWLATDIVELDNYASFDDLAAQLTESTTLLVDFPIANEQIVTIAVHDANGWRQDGICQFMFVKPTGTSNDEVIGYGEDLQDMFRGMRLGDTVIQSISPLVAQFVDGKWQVWSSQMVFYRDLFNRR